MLMPIVSMNRMAMNESIASGCCYRTILNNNGNPFTEVLFGGWIGDTTVLVKEPNENYPSNKAWISFYQHYSPTVTGLPIVFEGGIPGIIQEEKFVALSKLTTTDNINCAHDEKSASCTYYSYTYEYLPNVHIDSTVAHKGMDWQMPHNAFQFNS